MYFWKIFFWTAPSFPVPCPQILDASASINSSFSLFNSDRPWQSTCLSLPYLSLQSAPRTKCRGIAGLGWFTSYLMITVICWLLSSTWNTTFIWFILFYACLYQKGKFGASYSTIVSFLFKNICEVCLEKVQLLLIPWEWESGLHNIDVTWQSRRVNVQGWPMMPLPY